MGMVIMCIGAILIIYTLILFLITGVSLGNMMVMGLGVVLLAYNYIYKVKFLYYLFLFGLSCFSLLVVSLFVYGADNNVTYDEDGIIVLGCGLKDDGETVSFSLEKRLEASIKYFKKNPQAMIVVSGGQGSDENISEALAMEKYLISKGIPENKILMEDKSTSTYENFEFSKRVLDEYFKDDYKVAFTTNNYHIFRANSTAKKVGFDISHYSAKTPLYVVIPSYMREVLANIKYMFL